MDGVQKNKNKNLLVLIYLSLGLNLITAPIALFIGGMTTDPPGSTELDFLKGFLFIQAIPLFLLFIFLAWYFIHKSKYTYAGIAFFVSVIILGTPIVWIYDMYNSLAKKVFLIPDGYKGCIGVLYNIEDASPLKIEDKKIIYKVTKDGILKTSSNERFGKANEHDSGWYNVKYYYVDKKGNQVQRLKEGKDIHNTTVSSQAGLTYSQFFIGTKKEAEKHPQFSMCFNEKQQLQIDHK
ncbi:DUF6843 domain-containing protein [Bacillus toyonensis]|uniref:DUF6843 domain-containing protein n=1 Tax=Bacillus toyonensis TaxID=155322 RepID=UPI000BEB64FA|nr:hypothetical protein [Bacillus toyonensis]PED17385.1 hypothetical protein CON63_26300 [Bacillus toyonensis]